MVCCLVEALRYARVFYRGVEEEIKEDSYLEIDEEEINQFALR